MTFYKDSFVELAVISVVAEIVEEEQELIEKVVEETMAMTAEEREAFLLEGEREANGEPPGLGGFRLAAGGQNSTGASAAGGTPKFTWMRFESVDQQAFDLHVDDHGELYLAVGQARLPQFVRVLLSDGSEIELRTETVAEGFVRLTGPIDLVQLREEIADEHGRIRMTFLP